MKHINERALAHMYCVLDGYRETIAALDLLISGGPVVSCVGICSNAVELYGHLQYSARAFKTWPKFSGDREYPVPVHGFADPGRGYERCSRTRTLWDGEQGRLRRDLLRHLRDHYAAKAARIEAKLAGCGQAE